MLPLQVQTLEGLLQSGSQGVTITLLLHLQGKTSQKLLWVSFKA